jgi:hypothetical protein
MLKGNLAESEFIFKVGCASPVGNDCVTTIEG